MKNFFLSLFLVSTICLTSFAVPITLFMDTDTFLERAKDIIVAECVSVPDKVASGSFLQAVDVNILKVLKGDKKPGCFRIATIYPMESNTTYMLSSMNPYKTGGKVLELDFIAVPELSVVPLPETFKIEELKDKEPKEQVQYMFSRRLFKLERELAPLLKEKALLEKAVSDREYEKTDVVKIDANGATELNGKAIPVEEISEQIKRDTVIIRADRATPHKSVMAVMEETKEAGVKNVSLATDGDR